MAEERVDIVVRDRVSRTIEPKLTGIATAARSAASSVTRLNTALGQINSTAIAQLSRTQTAAQLSTVRLATAQQRLLQAQNQTATSAQRLTQATIRTTTAQTQNAIAAQRLAQAQQRTTITQNQAAASAIRLQVAMLNLARAQTRVTQAGSGVAAGVGLLSAISLRDFTAQILGMANAWQVFQQRINVATLSMEQSAAVQEELIRISAKTFTTLDAQADLFQRFDPIMKRYGYTIRQTLEVQENIAKAIAVSGATAAETKGALIQLAQAMGGNFKTAAQELNSILEQSPMIAKVFADQLRTTQDQLKAWAKAGQISTKDFIKAFSEGGKGIAELNMRFNKLNPTLEQAFSRMMLFATQASGEFLEATGITQGLTTAMVFLGENMEYVAAVAGFLFVTLTAGLINAARAMGLFNIAVLANPLVMGGAILAGAIAAFVVLSNKINGAKSTMDAFNTAATNALLGATYLVYQFIAALNYIPFVNLDDAVNSIADIGNALIEARDKGEPITKVLGLDMPRAAKTTSDALSEVEDWFEKVRTGGWAAGEAATQSFNNAASAIDGATMSLKEYNKQVQKAGGAKIIHVDESGTSTSDIMKIPGTSSSSITGIDVTTIDQNVIRGTLDTYALGGAVHGPGTGTSDSIPAMISNGEFIVNAAATSKYRSILEKINNSEIRHFAEGGYAPGDYSALGGAETLSKETSQGSFQLGGEDMAGLTASGFSPYIGMGGAQGGWEFTGPYSPEIEEAFLEQSTAIQDWTKQLKSWWTETKPTITDMAVQETTNRIVNTWLAGLPKYTVDPREFIPGEPIGAALNPAFDRFIYMFEDVTAQIAKAGYTASILSQAPPWGDTVGNYVTYAGPQYGQAIAYGGEMGTENYALEHAATVTAMPPPVTTDEVSDFFDTSYYGQFRNGGSFMVPGSGGPDSEFVQFHASPGEEVSVGRPSDAGSTSSIIISPGAIVVQTPDVRGFKESENEIVGRLTMKIMDYAERNGLNR